MHRWFVVFALVGSFACASSGTLPQSQTFMQPKDQVWQAAVLALSEMGGQVVTSNRSAGLLLGRVEAAGLGAMVTLDVTVSEWMDGAEVRVKAKEPGSSSTDPDRAEELRRLEEDYLELVDRLAQGMRRR